MIGREYGSDARCYLHARKATLLPRKLLRYGNYLLRAGDLAHAFENCITRCKPILTVPLRPSPASIGQTRTSTISSPRFCPPKRMFTLMSSRKPGAPSTGVAQEVWAHLVTLHPHLETRDFYRLVDTLLAAGRTPMHAHWDQGIATQNLPPLLQPQGSVIWDPSFESGLSNFSFAWYFQPIVQECARRSTAPKSFRDAVTAHFV